MVPATIDRADGRNRVDGPTQFVYKLLKTWKLDLTDAAPLLGLGASEADDALENLVLVREYVEAAAGL